MAMRFLAALALLMSVLSGPGWCNSELRADKSGSPVIVLDPGHTNKSPGALGISGIYEVDYNDNLVARIADNLTAAGFRVVLTRSKNQELTLEDRVAVANSSNAILLLSIHHDSAQLKYLEQIDSNGKKGYRTKKPISGFSIFVSGKNAQFDNSLAFAKILAEELLGLGRGPTLHHAEMIPGESRPLLDTRLGIYQYDNLVVLKKTGIPAVLLEAGLIVDEKDERYLSSSDNQDAIAGSIVRALKTYISRPGK